MLEHTEHVVAGVDGSPESFAAADWAAREALRRGRRLWLLHALEGLPTGMTDLPELTAPRSWSEQILRDAGNRLSKDYPELAIRTEQVAYVPVQALQAASEQAAVLVLGSRGLSGFTGFLVGSVALAAVARAQCPVVLVRAGESAEDEHLRDAEGRPSTRTPHSEVVLGLDVRHQCDELLEFAFDAAARRAAPLHVVCAHSGPPPAEYGPSPSAQPTAEDLERPTRQTVEAALHPWQEKFPSVVTVTAVEEGRAAHHLLRAAHKAGLLVIGRRARQTPVGPRIGSVAHAVIHHAQCPVAVVPHQ